MKIKVLSSLAKVFPDEICGDYTPEYISCLKNERTSFQIAVKPSDNTAVQLSFSDFSEAINAFYVKSVPTGLIAFKNHDDYFLRQSKSGDYPDILMPVDKSTILKGGEWSSFWVEIAPDGVMPCGLHEIKVLLHLGESTEQVTVIIKIENAGLNGQKLICTNWFHTDCLSEYYGVKVFSGEYWRIIENFMKAAVRHGINFILTPLFTPPLDTAFGGERPTVQLVDVKLNADGSYTFGFDNLKKWVDLALSSGVEYFEMSHLFTQWGARHAPKIIAETGKGAKKIFGWKTIASGKKYTAFLRAFAPELIRFIDENGIRERCVFHTSDEPDNKKYYSYRKAARITKELFGDFRIADTLSEYRFFEEGIIENPITNIENIKRFYGKVPELWLYYCCGPYQNYNPNRFIAMPSVRNRILGILMYKYEAKGFLQWGFNFYFTRYSRRLTDPFTETDAGGEFPSGDSFVVYPAPDGTPYISLRLKVFYDAIEDYEALLLLENKIGRDAVLSLLEDGLSTPLTAEDYPHSEKWLIEKRTRINEMLSEI